VIGLARIRRAPVALLSVLLAASLIAACGGPAASGDTLIGRTMQIGEAHPLSDPTATFTAWQEVAGGNQRILLNFWASWCIPCRDEIPLLSDYAASFVPGATVLGVLYKDAVGPAAATAAELGATWATLIDADGAIAAQVPVNAAPLTLLLDDSGVVLDYRVGPFISVAEIAAFADGP
jgi:cytochrome c biogenesis protein CcmG/thiol:disulfide interchange protein DsbE